MIHIKVSEKLSTDRITTDWYYRRIRDDTRTEQNFLDMPPIECHGVSKAHILPINSFRAM